MRQQKVRGYNRRFKHIEKWRIENLDLRHDLIEKYNGDHVDVAIHPWCDISIINSKIPEPNKKAKMLILNGLIDIYESWKDQLDKLQKPYYLKVWLYEHRFSKSRVVCALEDKIEIYNNIFYQPKSPLSFNFEHFVNLTGRLKTFDWDIRMDEDHFENNFIGESKEYATIMDYIETKRWFNKLLKKPHRTTAYDDPTGLITEIYSFRRGNIWIGQIN
mgnify:CR=1 FL=1